jgi:hypothetical protein
MHHWTHQWGGPCHVHARSSEHGVETERAVLCAHRVNMVQKQRERTVCARSSTLVRSVPLANEHLLDGCATACHAKACGIWWVAGRAGDPTTPMHTHAQCMHAWSTIASPTFAPGASTPWRSNGAPRCTTIDDAMCDGNVMAAVAAVARAQALHSTRSNIDIVSKRMR